MGGVEGVGGRRAGLGGEGEGGGREASGRKRDLLGRVVRSSRGSPGLPSSRLPVVGMFSVAVLPQRLRDGTWRCSSRSGARWGASVGLPAASLRRTIDDAYMAVRRCVNGGEGRGDIKRRVNNISTIPGRGSRRSACRALGGACGPPAGCHRPTGGAPHHVWDDLGAIRGDVEGPSGWAGGVGCMDVHT